MYVLMMIIRDREWLYHVYIHDSYVIKAGLLAIKSRLGSTWWSSSYSWSSSSSPPSSIWLTGIIEIPQSLCMACGESGMTRMILTKIPFFREVCMYVCMHGCVYVMYVCMYVCTVYRWSSHPSNATRVGGPIMKYSSGERLKNKDVGMSSR